MSMIPKVALDKLGIGNYKRHLIFCGGPKCCSLESGDPVWDYIKLRTKELTQAGVQVFRTRAKCLRVCQSGPIAVVYPEGTWYANVNKVNAERIISEHLVGGNEVQDLVIARNPL